MRSEKIKEFYKIGKKKIIKKLKKKMYVKNNWKKKFKKRKNNNNNKSSLTKLKKKIKWTKLKNCSIYKKNRKIQMRK